MKKSSETVAEKEHQIFRHRDAISPVPVSRLAACAVRKLESQCGLGWMGAVVVNNLPRASNCQALLGAVSNTNAPFATNRLMKRQQKYSSVRWRGSAPP